MPNVPSPIAALTIWDITVGVPLSYGIAWILCANQETPKTKEPSKVLMITSVRRAFTCSGALKSATPSEIASRPVKDDPPFAKARSKINMAANVSNPLGSPIGTAPGKFVSSIGSVPLKWRYKPIAKTINIEPTNK